MALLLAVICLLTLESFSYAYRLRNGAVVRFGRKFSLLSTAGSQDSDTILRQVKNWACVKSCGACCKLGPIEDRPDLGDYLSPEEYEKYVSMIGPDNWCKHYDQTNRLCTIYDDRPAFCRVEVNKFKDMYDIKEDEFSDFCTFCCQEHISDVYGEDSDEMDRFELVIQKLNPDLAALDQEEVEVAE